MDIFALHEKIVKEDYANYCKSFLNIGDPRIADKVLSELKSGKLWPDPLLQLNPNYAPSGPIADLVAQKLLHPDCEKIFRRDKSPENPGGNPLALHRHQAEAMATARRKQNYILTTGTGSGKSLAYLIPIIDHILTHKSEDKKITAIIVYPMNALANSQVMELEKFLKAEEQWPITFARYTGQESEDERAKICKNPPDILLTNYMMLELILTRPTEQNLIAAATGLEFLVFDELHTYRGRQGADVAMLIRRLRQRVSCKGKPFRCIGTSATLAGSGSFEENRMAVAELAQKIFGDNFLPENIIMETLAPPHGEIAPQTFPTSLASFLNSGNPLPDNPEEFAKNPLAIWLEHTIGVEKRDNRLERCKPAPITGDNGLAQKLAQYCGVDPGLCATKIRQCLLAGSRLLDNGRPFFAFKLHQFLSRGDTAHATLEDESTRHITLFGQKYAPNRPEGTLLFPLAFCRGCGKEYYRVSLVRSAGDEPVRFLPRSLAAEEDSGETGFLFVSTDNP